MATTTTNLNLPLFEVGDHVDLINTYNVAMTILDAYVYGLPTDSAVQQALTTAQNAASTATAASTAAAAAQSTANTAASGVTTIENKLTKTSNAATVGDLSSAILTNGGFFAIPDESSNNGGMAAPGGDN